jgi:protein involved in polysaccharide export with SLBB domain
MQAGFGAESLYGRQGAGNMAGMGYRWLPPTWGVVMGICLVSVGCMTSPFEEPVLPGILDPKAPFASAGRPSTPEPNPHRVLQGTYQSADGSVGEVVAVVGTSQDLTQLGIQLKLPEPLPDLEPAASPGDQGKGGVPVELCKVSLPPYIIEPPDILLIDTVRMIPLPPYRIEPLDVLLLQVAEALPNQPIMGPYAVTPDGTINLGYVYGTVRVAGLTLEEAQTVIRNQLKQSLTNPQVAIALGQSRTIQQVRGEHLVRPDGTINLGSYGSVYVAGMTLTQAKCAVEKYLSQFVLNPEISLDVFAYNSKVYYVITDGAGFGQQVFRFPITGNETVLDAISNIAGLPVVASKKYIWVARPSAPGHGCYQILPVDWKAITQGGATETNYQIFPGDRVYVRADCLITLDNWVTKLISPVERLFGVTLLGVSTVDSFGTNGNNGIFR